MGKSVTFEIESCAPCPWFVPHPLSSEDDWCNRLGRVLEVSGNIPDDCPLEDADDNDN